jgi:flagellar biosynthesis chaperone FliJ
VSAHHDPHLRVVARVRGIRERDSRLGLVAALAEESAAEARIASLQAQLDAVAAHESGTLASFTVRQHTVTALTEALVSARADRITAHHVALASRDKWRAERTRLAAVESLLARRSEARLVERRRRESRELDAVAEELWRRRRPVEVTP